MWREEGAGEEKRDKVTDEERYELNLARQKLKWREVPVEFSISWYFG